MMRTLAFLLCATGIGLVAFAAWSFLREPGEIAPLAPETPPLEGRAPDAAPAPSGTEPARPAPLDSLPFSAPPLSRPGGTTYPDRSTGPQGLMVVDPEGNPIPGAVIAICDRWDAAGPRVRRRERCDDRGIFEYDPIGQQYPIVFCTHAGAAGWVLSVELLPKPHGTGRPRRCTPTLALRRPTRVVVSVVDEGGASQAGERVLLQAEVPSVRHRNLCAAWPIRRTAVTDARGIAEFSIDPVDPFFGRARHFTAGVSGLGIGPPTRAPYDPEGDVRIDIVVPDGPTVVFRAVDGSGRQRDLDFGIIYRGETDGREILEGQLILDRGEAVLRTPWAVDRVRAATVHRVVGDLVVVPAPRYYVHGSARTHPSLERAAPRIRAPDQPDPLVVPVVFDDLPPVVTVTVHTPSGRVAAGRELGVMVGGEALHRVRLDDQGRFHMLGDRSRTLSLRPSNRMRYWFGETILELPETPRDLHLDPLVLEPVALLAAGRVAEEDGRPVVGARLRARGDGTNSEVRSAADGSFEIVGERLPAGKIELSILTTNPERTLTQEVDPGARDLLLILPALGDIEGYVKRHRLPDLPFIRIAVYHQALGPIETEWSSFRQPMASRRFLIEEVPAGAVDLRIETPTGQSLLVSGVEVVPGKTTRDPRLQKLDIGDENAFRRIDVLAPNGRPLPQAIVIWSAPDEDSGNTLLEMETDAFGVAWIAHNPGPPGLVVAEGPRGQMAALYAPIPPIRMTLYPTVPCQLLIPKELAQAVASVDGAITLRLTPQPPSCPLELLRGLPSRDLRLDGQPTQTLDLSPGRYRATLVRRPGNSTRHADLGAHYVGSDTVRFPVALSIDPAGLADLLR